jgi:hypothetical protein
LEYFGENLSGYDEHCPSISKDSYPKFVCRECSRYYPTKVFLKLHIKTTHSSERAPKRRATNEDSEYLPQGNFENTRDTEISNHEVRNVQISQGERKKSKGRAKGPCQQNLTAKPWEQDHLTFRI